MRGCWLEPVRGCGLEPERGCGLEPERGCGLEPVRSFGLEPVRGCGLEPGRCGLGPGFLRTASGGALKSAGSWACVQARCWRMPCGLRQAAAGCGRLWQARRACWLSCWEGGGGGGGSVRSGLYC